MRVSVALPVQEFRAVKGSQLDLESQSSYQFFPGSVQAWEASLEMYRQRVCCMNAREPMTYVTKVWKMWPPLLPSAFRWREGQGGGVEMTLARCPSQNWDFSPIGPLSCGQGLVGWHHHLQLCHLSTDKCILSSRCRHWRQPCCGRYSYLWGLLCWEFMIAASNS